MVAMLKRHKSSIRFKITLIIFLSTLIVVVMSIGLSYFFAYKLLRNTVTEDHLKDANLLSKSIETNITGELDDLHAYAVRLLWIDLVKEANLKYKNMDTPTLPAYFAEMDKKWINSKGDDLLVREYLESRVGISMQDVVQIRGEIRELFITDRFGGLVAASNKVSDFYQADEDWWKEAFNSGKGKDFVGDMEFDESSHSFSLPFAVPIKDRSGNVIGVCKAVVDISYFLDPLKDFSIGKTGHAVLVNNKGDILFHKGVAPLSAKFTNNKDFRKLLDDKAGWQIMKDPHTHKGEIFFIFVPVKHLTERGIYWYIFIDQDAKEVFAPLQELILRLSILIPILVIIMIPIGLSLSGIFVKPIRKLDSAIHQIMNGNWDYQVDVRTGDEIEHFADTFKAMISNIRNKQGELLRSKKELEDLSAGLEDKVKQRTKELSDAQKATLNILEDLTEANKKLEEAVKIKSAFTSTVSHELRTPLTAIKESIAIVLEGIAGGVNGQQMEFLNMAKNNVDRLTRLINDILDFQKLESGKMVLTIVENDINNVVEEVCKGMLPLANKKGLSLIIQLGEGLPRVKFDKDKIVQVLTNLINNAIKFTEKGSITVAIEKGDNIVRVTVKDTGPGIKNENLPKLFQQFEQLERGGERKTGGTGLGLAISKQIIEASKGKIWVESEFGKGASFIFVLPIQERRA